MMASLQKQEDEDDWNISAGSLTAASTYEDRTIEMHCAAFSGVTHQRHCSILIISDMKVPHSGKARTMIAVYY